jgi:hypothetical protein
MKKSMLLFVIAMTVAFVFNLSALADDKDMKMDHTKSAGDHGKTMDHSQHMGEKIHESKVEGYQFSYHLLNMEDREIHHMMVYILAPDGGKVEDAKVGYLVNGPDGTKQKMMAMGMKGAYGADLDFKQKGTYTVKMKAVTGDQKLLDEFTYEVE